MEKQFKIRASAAGKIMTSPRSKSETLSETTKTYLQEWLKEQIYGVRKEIQTKYMTKGTVLEDEAIDRCVQWTNIPFVLKNEKNFDDDFFTGTPDIITPEYVVDIKTSWDCFTFPLFDTEIPTKDYYYQLQVYMHLTGLKRAKLVYILLNTPEFIQWETPHDYEGLDPKYRHKVFDIDYSPEVIETLQSRVEECRNYINTLIK